MTFSPDTGAVIRERKVREAPRKVEGRVRRSDCEVSVGSWGVPGSLAGLATGGE